MKTAKCVFLTFCVLILSVVLVGCGVQSKGVTSAKIYLQQRPADYDKAIEVLNKELEANPNDAEAHFLLGKIYADQNMYEQMLTHLRKADELNAKNKGAIKEIIEKKWIEVYNDGTTKGNSTDLDTLRMSLERLELAILLDPTRYEAWSNAAAVSINLGDYKKALDLYEKAHQLKPDNMGILNGLASAYLNNQMHKEALDIYEKILAQDPKNINALLNISTIYDRMQEFEKALTNYNRIIEADPEYRDAYYNRGILYLNKAHAFNDSLSLVRDELEKSPEDKNLLERSKSLIERQKEMFLKAGADFKKTVELDPTDNQARYLLGYCYLNQNELDPAMSTLEEVVKANPDHKEAWYYLSLIYTRKGMKEKALDAAKKAKE